MHPQDLLTVLVIGPAKTPYEDGMFFFDVHLPNGYPNMPPDFHYISYCNDRLNPNLYEDGKVCVSLLGTWSGKVCSLANQVLPKRRSSTTRMITLSTFCAWKISVYSEIVSCNHNLGEISWNIFGIELFQRKYVFLRVLLFILVMLHC